MTYCTACVRQLDRPLLGRVTDTPASCCARSRSLGGSSRCQTANTSRNRAAVLRSGNKCFEIIGTAHVVIVAGSMRRYGVRPSVRQSLPAWAAPTAANPLLQVCCCGPGGQEISIDCCSSGGRRAKAGSATLSAYVGS